MRLMNQNFCTATATVVTASNIDPSFPVSNLKHPFRSKRVRTALGTTTLTVVYDMVTTEEIDSCVLLWPKEDGIRLSDTATIKIQANATNVWTSPAVDVSLSIDNTYVVASHFFSSAQSYRYWRVVIEDAGNAYDYVELGLCWLGKGLALDNAQNGFRFRVNDLSRVSSTDFGHDYVDEYPLQTLLEFTYQYLEYEQIEILENAFRENGTKYPVLVCFDPTEAVFNKNHYMVYGKMKASFESRHVNYDILDTDSITVTELS